MSENATVVETAAVEPNGNVKAEDVKCSPKESPAKDLRDIQGLLTNGMFPGNVAPAIIKAFNLLENMAQVVEREAAKVSNEAAK